MQLRAVQGTLNGTSGEGIKDASQRAAYIQANAKQVPSYHWFNKALYWDVFSYSPAEYEWMLPKVGGSTCKTKSWCQGGRGCWCRCHRGVNSHRARLPSLCNKPSEPTHCCPCCQQLALCELTTADIPIRASQKFTARVAAAIHKADPLARVTQGQHSTPYMSGECVLEASSRVTHCLSAHALPPQPLAHHWLPNRLACREPTSIDSTNSTALSISLLRTRCHACLQ